MADLSWIDTGKPADNWLYWREISGVSISTSPAQPLGTYWDVSVIPAQRRKKREEDDYILLLLG